MQFIKVFFTAIDKRLYFIFLCGVNILLTFISQKLLIGDEVYHATFGQQIAQQHIDQLISFQKKWQWISYAIIPLIYLIKITAISFCLSIGCLLMNHSISFKKLFQISLIAETIFLLPALIKIIWFWQVQQDFTLQDILNFVPLSLSGIYELDDVQTWLIYPLQVVNAFEILYWFILAFGIKLVLQKPFINTFKLVLVSYGTGLVFWVTFIIFLQLNFS